jgi:hypothetical protein
MTDVSIHAVVRHDPNTCAGSGDTLSRLASSLGLAGAPTFALMALWSAFFSSRPDMLCVATEDFAPMSEMTVMYLLMSAFHSSHWLKLIASRRNDTHRQTRPA